MTQEEKQLLLTDLCARLPYGLVLNVGDRDIKLDRQHQDIGILYPEDCSDEFNKRNNNSTFYILISGCYYGDNIKPYLRPMSSMTDSEYKEYEEANDLDTLDSSETLKENFKTKSRVRISKWYHGVDWLNAHHFDYRGLIEKGLALSTDIEGNPYV